MARGAVVALIALAAAACIPPPPSVPTATTAPREPAVPSYNWPAIAPGDPTDCLTILMVGDSLAAQTVNRLEATYEEHGYCATVADGTEGGASTLAGLPPPGQTSGGEIMWERFERLYAEHQPDAVVFSFVGNLSEGQVEPAQAAYLDLVDLATTHAVPVFVTTPPVSAVDCLPALVWSQTHRSFRTWVMTALPVLRPDAYTVVPWSEVFTPGGTWETYNDSLRFPDGVFVVRYPDCVHLGVAAEGRGVAVAATEVVAATQGLWS